MLFFELSKNKKPSKTTCNKVLEVYQGGEVTVHLSIMHRICSVGQIIDLLCTKSVLSRLVYLILWPHFIS